MPDRGYNEILGVGEDDFLFEITPYGAEISKLSHHKTSLEIWELMPRIAEIFWGLVDVQQAIKKGVLPEIEAFKQSLISLIVGENPETPYIVMGRIEGEEDIVLEVFANSSKQADKKFRNYLRGTDTFIEEVARRKEMQGDPEEQEPDIYIEFCEAYVDMRVNSIN
ncbi:MAG: hypothetical protein JKY54_12925 [Flavobacteriales bacterium]|nr:hypothetical protein [Flavobacteriales bacterium]